MPLGHHNLLAAWLVILLPLAVLPAREPGAWRFAGLAAGGLAAAAILASRSLAGCAALAAAALLAFGARAGRSRRRWGWLALLAAALLVSFIQLPRALRIASGADLSAQARGAYLAAGIEGFQARPMLGWGPGSVPWTAAAFLEPVLRVNPWGESVGDLHSLPVQLAYELGVTGLLLVAGLSVLFFVRRIAEREEGRDPALLLGGLLGLGSGAVASLGSGALAVTALPLAAAVAAGAALAGSGRGKARSSRLPVRIYALAALLALASPGARPLALRPGAAGRREAAREAEAELAAAMRLDPEFPLYPMRLALLRARTPGGAGPAAGLALRAAEKGGGIPSLWLVAGVLGRSAKAPWAGAALERACFLDPLDPFPPFYGMLAEPRGPGRSGPRRAGAAERAPARRRGLLGAPSRAARRGASALVRGWPGVDAGWKEALLAAVPPPAGGGRSGRVQEGGADDRHRAAGDALPDRLPPPPLADPLGPRRRPATGLGRAPRPPAAASKGTAARFLPCRALPPLTRWAVAAHAVSAFRPLPDLHKACGKPCGKKPCRPGKPRPHSGLTHFEQLFVQFRAS